MPVEKQNAVRAWKPSIAESSKPADCKEEEEGVADASKLVH